jgi:hypothetical protein
MKAGVTLYPEGVKHTLGHGGESWSCGLLWRNARMTWDGERNQRQVSIVAKRRTACLYPVSHSSIRGVLYTKIMVFSLAFAIRDSAKLSPCFGMLEHSFLGCKSGFRASDCIQRTGS